MPFEKVIEANALRFRWTGSTLIDATWRFIELTNRRGTLFVRIDQEPWTYYTASGTAASKVTADTVRGRGTMADKLIQGKIDARANVRRAPSKGNPYGRFPEGTEVGILGEYNDMHDIEFTELTDGMGMRVLNEGFIKIYNGYPAKLTDEWDRHWLQCAAPTTFRPFAVYVQGLEEIALKSLPSNEAVKAIKKVCGLPDVKPFPSHITLTPSALKVIQTLDRKTFDSQKKVMKNNSAAEVAALLGLDKTVSWEWLHLVAFSLGGHQGEAQIPENLVLGTAAANTAMMLVESWIKEQVEYGRWDTATLVVHRVCPVQDCGWFCTEIGYTVKLSSKFGKPVYARERFNPFLIVSPGFVLKQMMDQLKKWSPKSGPAPVPVSDTMRKPGPARYGRRL